MYLSLYCKGRKGCVGFYCERELEIEHNCNILTPKLMAVSVVSFSFFWCSTGAPGVHSAGCSLSLLHLISIFSGPQLIRAQRPLRPGCGFPYHISSPTPSDLQLLARRTQLSYIIVWHPLDLWNRMFNHHQAEITVHAVQRSLSSGASVYECTMGIF